MDTDLWDDLSQLEVPPVPADFGPRLHARLNRALLWLHAGDFVLRAAPQAVGLFFAAWGGLVAYTLTGRFPKRAQDDQSDRTSG